MKEKVLTRQELYDLVWITPMSSLAREFAMSDVGMAKLCRRHGIPRPGRGYWARRAAGRTVKKPKLPNPPAGSAETIRFVLPDQIPTPVSEPETPPEVLEWIERERRPENRIEVPARVHRYHPLLQRTRQSLEGRFGDPRGARISRREGLDVSVGAGSVHRACLLLQALVVALEKRGFEITTRTEWSHQTTVHLLGEEVSLSLKEHFRRQTPPPTAESPGKAGAREPWNTPRPNYEASGVLRLTLSSYGVDAVFKDRDGAPLESQLNDAVIAVVRLALEIHRPRRLKREEEERRRHEEQERQQEFERKRSWFEEAIAAWLEHERRLGFLSALEAKVVAISEGDDRSREYLAWARRYIDWADPIPRFLAALKAGEEPDFPRWRPPASIRTW